MKKFLTDIRTMAALLMASATLAACSSEDNIIDEQPVQPKGQVYTMTVSATKGGDAADSRATTTRALSLDGEDGKTLNATWATYEDVYVKKDDSNEWASGLLLPAETLTSSCYMYMFNGCTALTKGPELPAETLAYGCYGNMFSGCSALTEAPALPAKTLANACYASMFQGCRALTTAPELPAKTLVQQCYMYMFKGCGNLNYVKCLATSGINDNYSTYEWLANVYTRGGSLEIDQSATSSWTEKSDNGIPIGWIVYDPTKSHPLTNVTHGDWKNPGDWKKVIGSDGTIYNKVSDMAEGVTPVAFILYFGSNTGDDTYKHGLAIAWEDESNGATMTFEAAKAAIESKTAVPGGKWKLLESKPWSEIFEACGNLSADGNSGNMNKWIGEVGGQTFVKGDYYWSGTVHTDAINEDYIKIYNFAGEWTAFSTWSKKKDGKEYKVRAVLVF